MRNIVVTGGAAGIGRAIAARFVADGDQLWITGRRRAVLDAAAAQLGAEPVDFDITDSAQIGAALDRLPDRIDVLVNNGGGNTDLSDPVAGDGLAALDRAWTANLRAGVVGPVLVTSALLPRISENGRIVTIGSIAAKTGAAGYGAGKAAIEAWTAELSAEVGRRGITVNIVAPGLILDTGFFHGRLTDERTAALIEATHTGRAGTVDDVAETVHFLAGEQALHLTGQLIALNGGAYLAR